MKPLSQRSVAITTTASRRKKFLWRVLWVPFAVLSTIPMGFTLMGAYNYTGARAHAPHARQPDTATHLTQRRPPAPLCNPVGNKAKARGWWFYAWTGWLCLPLIFPFCLGFPYVYATDWTHRTFLVDIMNWWAQSTTRPFFTPRIIGLENLPAAGEPAVLVANHQVS
jgi:hypothetical protein